MKGARPKRFLTDISTGLSDAGAILVCLLGGVLSYQVFLQSAVGY